MPSSNVLPIAKLTIFNLTELPTEHRLQLAEWLEMKADEVRNLQTEFKYAAQYVSRFSL